MFIQLGEEEAEEAPEENSRTYEEITEKVQPG